MNNRTIAAFKLDEKWIVFGLLFIYFILCAIWQFNTNAPWDDDCVGRYFNTKAAIKDPTQFVNLWNRPLFVILFFLPFQLSKHTILLMAVLSAFSAYALYLATKELKIPNAYLVVPMLLFQAFYFTISRSALAEPLAAAIICFGYLFFVRKQFLAFAIAGSLLPLARLELSVLLILWAYILYINKQQKYVLLLIVPCVLWSLAGTIMNGGLFWLYDQTAGKSDTQILYNHTSFGHYFQRYIYIIGPVLFYFFFIGLMEFLYKKKYNTFLIRSFVLIFFTYVIFSWKLTMGQAAGFLRHMVALSPLASVLGLHGFNYWIKSIHHPEKINDEFLEKKLHETKAKNRKSEVTSTTVPDRNHDDTYLKYRVLFYSILMIVLSYWFFSNKLFGHQSISNVKDYTNLIILASFTLLFIILNVVFWKRSLPDVFKYGIAFLLIGSLAAYTLITEPPDINNSIERKAIAEISDLYLHSYLKNYPIYINHEWFFWANDITHDSLKYKHITIENLEAAPDSSIIFWENHYSNRLTGNVPVTFFQQRSEYIELYSKLVTDNKFTRIFIAIFQKIKYPDQQKVLALFDRFMIITPDRAGVYYNKARYEVNVMKNYEGAVNDYTSTINADTNYFEAYYNRGANYLRLKQYALAEKDFAKAVQLKPQDYGSHFNRGLSMSYLKDYLHATDEYSQAIRLRPDTTETYFDRAMAYANTGIYDKAMADYSKVIELNPRDAQSYFFRGRVLIELKHDEEACADFKKADELGYPQAKDLIQQHCK